MSRQEDIMKFLQYWSRLLRFHFVPDIFSDHLLFIRVNNTKGLLLLPLSALTGHFLFRKVRKAIMSLADYLF